MTYTFACWKMVAGSANIIIIWELDMLIIISSCDLAGEHYKELFGLRTALDMRVKSCTTSLDSVRTVLNAAESWDQSLGMTFKNRTKSIQRHIAHSFFSTVNPSFSDSLRRPRLRPPRCAPFSLPTMCSWKAGHSSLPPSLLRTWLLPRRAAGLLDLHCSVHC
jgi:hypothetical protein